MITKNELISGKEFFLSSISKRKELIVGKISYCGIDHMNKDCYIFMNVRGLYILLTLEELNRVFNTFSEAKSFLLESEEKRIKSEITRKNDEIKELKNDVTSLSYKLSTLDVINYDDMGNSEKIKSGKDWIMCLVKKYGPNQMIIHSKENYEIWKTKYGKKGTKGSFNSYVNRIIKSMGYTLEYKR